MNLIWIRGLLRKRAGSLAATVAGVMIAVALLASLGAFLASAQASMTLRAASGVAVDWQVQVAPGEDAAAVLARSRTAPGVQSALPVGFAQTSGLRATSADTTQTTGPGVLLGLPEGYAQEFPGQIRQLAGTTGGVLVAQQTAANLHVAPGDTITIEFTGTQPVDVTVAGVIDLPQANSLFQTVGAPAQSQPTAPPDNVVLLPQAQFRTVTAGLAAARPDLVTTQIHVARSHALASDPAVSFVEITAAAQNLEATLAGAGMVGNNLGAALDAARGDSSYATVMFLFLGFPGAVLAGLLTVAVAQSGAGRRRREQALLRARGASAPQIAHLVAVEAVVLGVVGGILGLGLAQLVGVVAFHSASFGASPVNAILWAGGAFAAGLVIALAAVLLPAMRDIRLMAVSLARAQLTPVGRPWWMRAYLDVILLAVAGIVLFVTTRTGYSLVLAPEGVAAIEVNYWAFFGPGLFWVGAGLLTWRLMVMLLARGRKPLTAAIRPLTGNLARTASAMMSRQRGTLARATVMLALALAFAASTATFNATYLQQAEVDAVLTNGADITITEPPGIVAPASTAPTISRVAGVRGVEPLQHRFAYVGSDLQDLYGVRASTIAQATDLQDAYFQGGTAQELMKALASQPDALLVSAETVADFQLNPGDLIQLRLQQADTKTLVTVPFHYVGVANEFPTAPKDSFFIANADYISTTTHDDSVNVFLVDTQGQDTHATAARMRSTLGSGAKITSIGEARSTVGSSLTSVDLAGLTTVELSFALVLCAAAGGLLFALSMTERRRSFAIATLLGARPRQLRGMVLAEAAVLTVGGLLGGTVLGWLLAQMLVAVLNGVFDPPPASLSIPWPYLTTVGAIAVVTIMFAALGTARASRQPAIEILRDL
jgi:putative ABC transport system permease protein